MCTHDHDPQRAVPDHGEQLGEVMGKIRRGLCAECGHISLHTFVGLDENYVPMSAEQPAQGCQCERCTAEREHHATDAADQQARRIDEEAKALRDASVALDLPAAGS